MQKAANIRTNNMILVQVYIGVTGDLCVTCDKKVVSDTHLRIGHGSSCVIRNITWKVTRELIGTPIIGRCELESKGCDNRTMLLAAKDIHGYFTDVEKLLKDESNTENGSGTIAALFGQLEFHSWGSVEENDMAKGTSMSNSEMILASPLISSCANV